MSTTSNLNVADHNPREFFGKVHELSKQEVIVMNSSFLRQHLSVLPFDNKQEVLINLGKTGLSDAQLSLGGFATSLKISGVSVHLNFDQKPAKTTQEEWQRTAFDVCAMNNLSFLKH